jgi:hypothetical protein
MKLQTTPMNARTLAALTASLHKMKLKSTVSAVVTIQVDDDDDYMQELAQMLCKDCGVSIPQQLNFMEA